MESGSEQTSPLRQAVQPAALAAALRPQRPVFADPWDSPLDMFALCLAIGVAEPLLLWAGAELMGSLFGFGSHWRIGVYIAAGLVGAAGFMTIVGRQRTNLAVDVLTIAAWVVLGLVVAPILGLAPPVGVSIASYGALLILTFLYVVSFGRWEKAFVRTLSWPITWSLLAIFFAWAAYRLILYP